MKRILSILLVLTMLLPVGCAPQTAPSVSDTPESTTGGTDGTTVIVTVTTTAPNAPEGTTTGNGATENGTTTNGTTANGSAPTEGNQTTMQTEKPTTTTTKRKTTTTAPLNPKEGVDFAKDFDQVNGSTFLLPEGVTMPAPETVSAWVRLPKGVTSDGQTILGNLALATPRYISEDYFDQRIDVPQFSFYVTAQGNPACLWYSGRTKSFAAKAGSVMCVVDDVDLRSNEWTHIAFVRDPEAGKVTFYLNGKAHKTFEAKTGDFTLGQRFGLGGDLTACASGRFRGEIKGLSVWSVPHTAEQIKQDADGNIKKGDNGLVAYWPLKEDGRVADVLADITGKYSAERVPVWVDPADYTIPDYNASIVLLPDVQSMTQHTPQKLKHMMQWIADNKDALKLKFVAHLGDLTNGNFDGRREEGEWEREMRDAAAAMKFLTDAGIPFSHSLGNHDYDETSRDRDTTLANRYFPASLQESYDCFGGTFEEGKIDNQYFLLDINGQKWMILALEFGPRDAVIDWANDVVKKHKNYNVIITSHAGVNQLGNWSYQNIIGGPSSYTTINSNCNNGRSVWEDLVSKHKNIVAYFNGHWTSELMIHRTDVGDHGNVVHSFQIDYTWAEFNRGGTEIMALLTFGKDGKTLTVSAYSPVYGYYYGKENQVTFTIGK